MLSLREARVVMQDWVLDLAFAIVIVAGAGFIISSGVMAVHLPSSPSQQRKVYRSFRLGSFLTSMGVIASLGAMKYLRLGIVLPMVGGLVVCVTAWVTGAWARRHGAHLENLVVGNERRGMTNALIDKIRRL